MLQYKMSKSNGRPAYVVQDVAGSKPVLILDTIYYSDTDLYDWIICGSINIEF